MTKCHLPALTILIVLTVACKSDKTLSLSEYGARSQATRHIQFEQYARNLLSLPLEQAVTMQDSVLRAAADDSLTWHRTVEMQERFFFNPNSPYRNEELYLPVVGQMLASPLASEEQRERAAWLMPRLKLNRPGRTAADFSFITPMGRQASLHAIIDARKPQRTILFFSNPGCDNCREIAEALSLHPVIQARIEAGKLLVVNIYPDTDLQAWLDYLPNYPKEWISGYDPDQILNSETIYWLRAIPSLYLLDEQKRVILKDATLEQLLSALSY